MAGLFDSITDRKKRVTFQYTTEDGTAIELIKIDATRVERHSLKSKATEHEVEDGSDISDHIIKKGRRLTIDGVVSDTPINLLASASGNIGGLVGNVTTGLKRGVITGAVSKIGSELISKGEGKPSLDAFILIDYLYEQKIPIEIVTGLKTYINMVMEDFDNSRTPQNANSLDFTATFKEITIVESEVVDIPPAVTENEGNIGQKKEGKKPSIVPSVATAGKASTLLFKMLGQ